MSDELLALVGPDVHDDVARCAAAAGYRMLAAQPAGCRRAWLRAEAVAVDVAALDAVVSMGLPRRGRLVLVGDREPSADIWRTAVDLGADLVATLPADETRLVAALTDFRAPPRRPAGAVAVVGGHGGAGASILAAAVALVCGEGSARVLLLDVDAFGAGADLALGVENAPGLRWQDLTLEGGTVRGSSLHNALPHVHDSLSVLAPRRDDVGPIGVDAVTATLDAGRANGDIVVVDLPRSVGPVADAVLDSVDLTVVVTTASVPGVAASRTVAAWTTAHGVATQLAVRGPAPSGLRAADVASAVALPLIAAYRSEPALPARLDAGRLRMTSRSPLRRAAAAIRDGLDAAEGRAA